MPERLGRNPIILTTLLAAYVVAGKFGLALALVNPSATAVWAPAGLALSAFVICGYRSWPVILAGAFIVNVTTAGSIATSLLIAIGNTIEGVAGAYLMSRFAGGTDAFAKPNRIFRFVLIVALCSAPISATFGVTTLSITGYARWSDYFSIWTTWWLGNLTGDLVIVPFVILWSTSKVATMRW